MKINDKSVYKIKDSVDVFLSNESYLMIYYMNARQRKSFKANKEMVKLIESIDGVRTVADLKAIMKNFEVPETDVEDVLRYMINEKIITTISCDAILPDHIKKRYERQINYFSEFLKGEQDGELAQKKLMSANVLIFGCGAIGGNIALELAMTGVSNFILVDYDLVEESDASRHMYYRNEYIGKNKVEALTGEIKKINSEASVNSINLNIRPESDIEEIIEQADFVVNTMDEPYIGYTAAKISRICVKKGIAHFIGGGFDAHLASTGEIIVPFVTPCVECYAKHFKKKLASWKPKKHPVQLRYKEIGGIASMSLFSTSFACIEIIKYLTNLVNISKEYKVRGEFLFTNMELTYLDVKKNPECPICGGENETQIKF